MMPDTSISAGGGAPACCATTSDSLSRDTPAAGAGVPLPRPRPTPVRAAAPPRLWPSVTLVPSPPGPRGVNQELLRATIPHVRAVRSQGHASGDYRVRPYVAKSLD